MNNLPNTLTQLKDMLDLGKISLDQAANAQERRFEKLAPKIGCVTLPLTPHWSSAGPLAGVGLAHKDVFALPNHQPGEGHDRGRAVPGLGAAPCMARLEGSGAANLGTLFMTEYACGATAENVQLQTCFNPLDRELALGGSSGGSGAAVASGMVYASLCTDTAGSVRIPAFTCGMMGLKTTHGLVPLEGVGALAPSLDSVGVISRSALDTLSVLNVIAESHLLRPAPEHLRIKSWFPENDLHPVIAKTLKLFMSQQGAKCPATGVLDTLPHEKDASRLLTTVLAWEVAQIHRASLQDKTANRQVTDLGLLGASMPVAWYESAIRLRPHLLERFVKDAMLDCDVLLLPAHGQPLPLARQVYQQSPEFDAKSLLSLHRYMGFVNYLGLPALVMPIGKDDRGFPISVQAVGRPYQELALLKFALSVEQALFGQDGIPSINNL